MHPPTHHAPRVYQARRKRIADAIGPDAALVLHGGQLRTRSNDTEFRFRPDSNFHYLTGMSEPGSVLVLRPGREPELCIFVRARDREAEIWSGRRVGPEGAREHYGADAAHPLSKLEEELPKLLDGVARVYTPLGKDRPRRLDTALNGAMDRLRRRDRFGDKAPDAIFDARSVMGEERIVKDEAAVASLRRAVDITVEAHTEAMRRVRPGMFEYEIEALIEYAFRRTGSSGPGYGSIVAGGENATILHYVDNTDRLREGELLLVDAGAEWDYFSGDLTRTYPVSGRFTAAQRDLYQVVLEANLAGIEHSVVGETIDSIHARCLRILCQGLVDLGLLSGEVDGLIENEAYTRYYMHRTSHWLGVDVHDAGFYRVEREPRPLQPGFVLTIEPALYVAEDDHDAPRELRGCGIRIEDDVLVTDGAPDVLTHASPKTIDDLEDLVGSEAEAAS